MNYWLFLFLLILTTSVFADENEDVRAMCSSAKHCLAVDLAECSEQDKMPLPKVEYDAEFCGPFYELKNRGLNPYSSIAQEIYKKLGKRYRAVYVNTGVLPVSGDMMSYLFDHFPFTTKLVNAYQGTAYHINYDSRDKRTFSGTNGGSLNGNFYWVLQDSAGMYKGYRNVFYGSGRAKILRWQLHGLAVAFIDLYPFDKNHVTYKLTAIVFPANSVLNSIMQMSVFKTVVNDKISEIVENIAEASTRYAKGDHKPIEQDSILKTSPYKEQLKEFLEVAGGEPWTLGDELKNSEMKNKKKKPVFITETPLIFKQPKERP